MTKTSNIVIWSQLPSARRYARKSRIPPTERLGSPMQSNSRTRPFPGLILLVLAAFGLPATPSAADDASALLGNWRVPPYEQQRMRMSEQCQRNADTNVQNVAESEVEVFSCDE